MWVFFVLPYLELIEFFEFRFTSFLKYEEFSAIIRYTLWSFFSSTFRTSIMHILVYLMRFCKFLKLCSLFFILFSFCSSGLIIANVLSLGSLIVFPVQICHWTPYWTFHLFIGFLISRISIWFPFIICLFLDSPCFVHTLFSWFSLILCKCFPLVIGAYLRQ